MIYFKKLGVILGKIAYKSHFKLFCGRQGNGIKQCRGVKREWKISPHKNVMWNKFLKNFWQQAGQFSAIKRVIVLFCGFRRLSIVVCIEVLVRGFLAYLSQQCRKK